MRYTLVTLATLTLALSAGTASASDLSAWMMGYNMTDPEAVGLFITTVSDANTDIVAVSVDAAGNAPTAPTYNTDGDAVSALAVLPGEKLGDFIDRNELSVGGSHCATFIVCTNNPVQE